MYCLYDSLYKRVLCLYASMYKRAYCLYTSLYKGHFKRILNAVIVSALPTSRGNEFHNRGAAILNARDVHTRAIPFAQQVNVCLKS